MLPLVVEYRSGAQLALLGLKLVPTTGQRFLTPARNLRQAHWSWAAVVVQP
jgi:hypothetical protein